MGLGAGWLQPCPTCGQDDCWCPPVQNARLTKQERAENMEEVAAVTADLDAWQAKRVWADLKIQDSARTPDDPRPFGEEEKCAGCGGPALRIQLPAFLGDYAGRCVAYANRHVCARGGA